MKKLVFLPRIESMRGIAATAVVGYHVGLLFDDLPATNTMDALAFRAFMGVSNGIGAVVALFVLNGFVLARSLDNNPNSVRYFRNRFFRLFPAAIAVVGLLAGLHYLFGIYVGFEVTPLAYLSRRFIELPFIALGRRLGAPLKTFFVLRTNEKIASDA